MFRKLMENPETPYGLMAIGQGLSQLGAGQPVNLQPAMEAMQARRQRADMKRQMEESGILGQFTPQQQALLASMPPNAAQEVIASVLFREPDPAPKLTTFKGPGGVEFSFNPVTGETKPLTEAEAVEPKPPKTLQATLSDGSEAVLQWDQDKEAWIPAPIPEGGSTAQPRGRMTEAESRKTLFQSLQTETAPVLDRIEETYDPANIADAVARNTPIAGAFFESEQGKIYRAASAQWAEGALRLATGAAATPEEMERTMATYFARPGDTPAVIKFKSDLRASYERSLRRSLGESVEGTLELPMEFAERQGAPIGTLPSEAERQQALQELQDFLDGGK